MALALRLFLPLLLAVALPARAAQAAPLQARGAGWDGDMAYPDALLDESLENSLGEILLENAGGPSPWKNSDTGDKKSLEAARHLDQMLSDLERRREMKRKAVLKAAFPGGSCGPLAAPAAGSEAMPGTVTGAWDGDMASPDALLDDSLENSLGENLLENAGGPSPWKNSDTGDKKSLEAARHLDQMLSDLERRREMKRKAVLKAAFPGGSSGPLAAPAAGSEAMPGTVTGAWDGDMASPDALLDDSLENSLGENLLENAGGPSPWKNSDTGDKKSLEAARHLDQMLSDLERRREMKRKAVLKAAFPGGSSGPLAAPAAGSEAMPGTVTGAWDGDMASPDALLDDSLENSLGENLLENAGGPSPWKNSDTGEKKSLEAARHLDQMLSDLERRREMKRKAVLKAAFPGGSSGPLAAPAAGSEAMPGTVTGAWDGDMASPDALLDDSLENSLGENLLENAGGPSPWKNSDTGEKKSLEAARHLDQMLSDLERRREMKRKAVLKAAFPGGSSGPLAAPAAGSEAMPGTVTGAWDGDMASPDALLDDSLENSLGENLLENAGGPSPWKNSDTGDKKSLEAARHLDQMLSDLERRREMDQRALLKAALPEGSRGSVPAPDTRREEMPDSATEDVITETGIFAPDPVRLPRIVCPQDVRRSCMIGTVVTLFTVPLVLIGCYLGIRKLYQSRRSVVDFSPQLSCNSAHSIGSLTRSHAALELWPVRGCPKNSAEGSAAAQCFHWPLHCWALSWGARWGCSQCWLPLRLPGQEQPRGHRAEAEQVLNSIWATQLRTGQCLFSSSCKVSW
ncbi:uncharacterized protein LOC128783028 isoform X3 [Vidua chalybeata]|uniref:uncharacterized protein LOC128783028 isoform X3 n=1 Tax=Vidua chalybeata TaxID=81927 RepID=UPI0023A8343C|nr:uncharacterized protein LOC128783028 isoform X3 [Vidua chalybeata]